MYKTGNGWYVLSDREWDRAIEEGARYRCTRCNLPHTREEASRNNYKCLECGSWLKKLNY